MVKRHKKIKSRKISRAKTGRTSAKFGSTEPKAELLEAVVAEFNSGNLDSAEKQAKALIDRHPGHSLAWKVLGGILLRRGRPEDAIGPMSQAIKVSPGDSTAYNNLGIALHKLGRLQEAQNQYIKAIKINPNFAEAHSNLGDTLRSLKQFSEAEESWQRALAIKPRLPETLNNWGNLLTDLGRNEEAEIKFKQALGLNPSHLTAYFGLGVLLINMGRYPEAEEICRKALDIQPDSSPALNNMGLVLMNNARFDEAVAHFKRAIAVNSDDPEYHSNLLFTLNYDPSLTASDLYQHYEAYGQRISAAIQHRFNHDRRDRTENRRIRIGYSSPDFCGHSCRFFLEPLFRSHDRNQFELFAYSNTPREDGHTVRVKEYFDHWLDVTRMPDQQMAETIYSDEIDILVDLAGHTRGNRLPVFVMRPAPIQASSSVGSASTTGLKEIDYFICDENLAPPGSDCYFSEQPWRVPAPGFAYEARKKEAPEVSELPALRNGYVTFGSLARTVRFNDPLLRIWGRILSLLPHSRLRLDQQPFKNEATREAFWQRLENLDIPRERVDVACSSPHWDAYHNIDIALDCWPHNAGTTTLESLWMGVPVISKIDRPATGSIGAAILRPLGLSEWLVDTDTAFIEKAVYLASNLDELAAWRARLRSVLELSPHLSASTYTKNLERAYQQMILAK